MDKYKKIISDNKLMDKMSQEVINNCIVFQKLHHKKLFYKHFIPELLMKVGIAGAVYIPIKTGLGKTIKITNAFISFRRLKDALINTIEIFLGTNLEDGLMFLVKSYLFINVIKQLISIEINFEESGIIITLVELNAFDRGVAENTLLNKYNENRKNYELPLIELNTFTTCCNNLIKLKCIKLEDGCFMLVEKVKVL